MLRSPRGPAPSVGRSSSNPSSPERIGVSAIAVSPGQTEWFQYKDIYIHTTMFLRGILVYIPVNVAKKVFASSASDNSLSFTVGKRAFFCSADSEQHHRKPDGSSLRKVERDLAILDSCYTPQGAAAGGAAARLKLSPGVPATEAPNVPFFFNTAHKTEIFVPISIGEESTKQAIYGYVWPSDNSQAKPALNGITRVISAGCLGAGIMAEFSDDETVNSRFRLIKHNIGPKFYNSYLKIGNVLDSAESHLYETVLLKNFQKLLELTTKYSKAKLIECVYHLPYYDYILFGIELHIQGRITLDALGSFFCLIFQRTKEYKQKLEEIKSLYSNIKLRVESPFDNLFGPMDVLETEVEALLSNATLNTQYQKGSFQFNENVAFAIVVLQKLDLPLTFSYEDEFEKARLSSPAASVDDFDATLKQANQIRIVAQKEEEKKFVERCLLALQNNTYDLLHAEVWGDFCHIAHEDMVRPSGTQTSEKTAAKIASVEDLLTIGNALLVAVTTRDQGNNETLVFQELTEKPIQITYANICRPLNVGSQKRADITSGSNSKAYYPAVINLTMLDSIVPVAAVNGNGHAPDTTGKVFYASDGERTVTKLCTKGILSDLSKNTALFASGRRAECHSIDAVLSRYDNRKRPLEASSVLPRPRGLSADATVEYKGEGAGLAPARRLLPF